MMGAHKSTASSIKLLTLFLFFTSSSCLHILFSSSHVDRVSSIYSQSVDIRGKDRPTTFSFLLFFLYWRITSIRNGVRCSPLSETLPTVSSSSSWLALLFPRRVFSLFVFHLVMLFLALAYFFVSSLFFPKFAYEKGRRGRKEGSERNRNYTTENNKKMQSGPTLAHQTCIMHSTYENCVWRAYGQLHKNAEAV